MLAIFYHTTTLFFFFYYYYSTSTTLLALLLRIRVYVVIGFMFSKFLCLCRVRDGFFFVTRSQRNAFYVYRTFYIHLVLSSNLSENFKTSLWKMDRLGQLVWLVWRSRSTVCYEFHVQRHKLFHLVTHLLKVKGI